MNLELEIFRNLFFSIAEEMGAVLRRTAFSPNIKERRDYSCALYDCHGETVAMGDHMPAHLGAMPYSVAETLSSLTLEPGDFVILNDPFRGGTHLPDITSVSGVFFEAELKPQYYLATRAHHSDVGGMTPGSMPPATEIFQEGLRIPPVKLFKNGHLDEDIFGILLLNSRTPEERRGDIGAQIAAHRVGERRLKSSTQKYGTSCLRAQMEELKNYSEALMRSTVQKIPDGTYESEDFMDDDGFGSQLVPIHCLLKVTGDSVSVDYSRSADQTLGGINANRAVVTAASMYSFRCLIRGDVPYNAGMLRPIEIITRKGSILDPYPPASVAAGNVETSQRIVDVLFGALAHAIPEQIPAASAGTMNNLTFGGVDPNTKTFFAYYETIAGGMGGRSTCPGLDACHTNMTNSLNTPVEVFEHELPLLIKKYNLRHQSAGQGKQRGGCGVTKEFEFLADTEVVILSERRVLAPQGRDGGGPGGCGQNYLNNQLIPGKVRFSATRGDRLTIKTPGGGGYGSEIIPID